MQEKLKEPRIYMCAAFFLAMFLPWMKFEAEAGGVSADTAMNGFNVIPHSIFGILLMLVLAALIAMELLPQIQMKMSIFYLGGAALGIILLIILSITAKGGAAAGASIGGEAAEAMGQKMDSSASVQIGFWLQMLLLLAMIVLTLIKDFAVNKEALKEQGIKGVFTEVAGSVTKDFTETAEKLNMPGGISDIMGVPCPSCGANVIKGKKFCNKCGAKMPEARPKEAAPEAAAVEQKTAGGTAGAGQKTAAKTAVCANCGEQIPSGVKFCPDCGCAVKPKEVQTNCKNCQAKLIPGKKFCPECGTKVED